jgi:cyclopropane-fatty-acyl-phospholipid synthase
MSGLLEGYLNRLVRVGRLTIVDHKGRSRSYGAGGGPEVVARFHDAQVMRRLAVAPALAVGECYMDGSLTLDSGDIYDLFELLGANMKPSGGQTGWFEDLTAAVAKSWRYINDRATSKKNVAHHYDISNALYRRFLDSDMQYSCAYYARPDMTLEEAQVAKKAHIAAKLLLEPGQRVLDIGSGWGGLGISLAKHEKIELLGVTLSVEQLALAQAKAKAAGVDDRVRFELRDYRDVEGPFDRIVSVGMFEHVGRPNYQTYFDTCARLLKDDGVMLLHAIGRSSGAGSTNPWIAKYIFPGGYIPGLSEVLPYIEKAGLIVTDIEILRTHYAETCKAWRENFRAQWDEIAAEYDEPFCRMFDFYLAGSESTFRHRRHMVFHIQLSKTIDAAPITRDYVAQSEAQAARRQLE